MSASFTPPMTVADLMRILDETLHEVLTGDVGATHASSADSPNTPADQPDQPRKTDTAQIHAAVTASPQPQKLTRHDYDFPDDF